jgi:hypothetical protein
MILLGVNESVMALNRIDKYILNHGVTVCNGEGPDCNDFYTRAVALNDYREPISPELTIE